MVGGCARAVFNTDQSFHLNYTCGKRALSNSSFLYIFLYSVIYNYVRDPKPQKDGLRNKDSKLPTFCYNAYLSIWYKRADSRFSSIFLRREEGAISYVVAHMLVASINCLRRYTNTFLYKKSKTNRKKQLINKHK